jgi:hypothetical protein
MTDRPLTLEEQLRAQPRRTAGVDLTGQPVRLGERDGSGHIVGYIDEQGLAWESLAERIVAIQGHKLADAIALPYEHPDRDRLIDEALANVPDELISQLAQEAANRLLHQGYRGPANRPGS